MRHALPAVAVAALTACGSGELDESPRGGAGAAAAGAAGMAGAVGGQAGAATKDPCALVDGSTGFSVGDRLAALPLAGGTTLADARRACDRPGLVILRVEAGFCAPCGRRADDVATALAPFPASSIDVVTLLYAGRDGAPATATDAARWAMAHPELPGLVAASPEAASAVATAGIVPFLALVDRRTLEVLTVLDTPTARGALREAVRAALVTAKGPSVTLPNDEPPLVDGRFDALAWADVVDMGGPLVLPKSATNAVADDPGAAALGKALFDDPALGGSMTLACAGCHLPSMGFSDGLPVAHGVADGKLNTPAIATAGFHRFQFWDGRADSAWSQALGPIENPLEMAGTRLGVAHRVASQHASAYVASFGPLPDLADTKRFPLQGKPGDPSWEGMTPADREAITRVFVNVGKSIEAMERTLRPPETRLSKYAAGDFAALSEVEKHGLETFLAAGCVQCHHGPTLTDEAFHDILMPASDPAGPADMGRKDGLVSLLASPFRGDGPYSDDPAAGALVLEGLVASPGLVGQVKTPSLRGLPDTGPYGHGGTFATLGKVVEHYGRLDPAKLTGPAYAGTRDPALARFAAAHDADLVAFLEMLGGD